MSIHKSLSAGRRAGRHRNVLTREERIAKLEEETRWTESDSSVFGLPKVRSIKPVTGKKSKKKEAVEAAEGAEAAAAPEAAESDGGKK